MKTSKTTVIGLLICLSSIFYHDTYWLGAHGLECLPELARYGFPIGLIIALVGLFADRTHYISDNENSFEGTDTSGISKIVCPNCNKEHDIDYLECPYCKHKY